MRGELIWLLDQLDLASDDLLFKDEVLDKCSSEGQNEMDLFLVDHNELSTGWKLSHPSMMYNVRAIIDHHADANQFLDAEPRIVKTCGSNASLLLDFLSKDSEISERLDEVKNLLASAIILDTVNLSWRETDLDIQWASEIYTGRPDTSKEVVQEICKPIISNFDSCLIPETNFKFYDLLYKDYKLYSLEGRDFYYAISTLKTSFQTFIETEFEGSVEKMIEVIHQFMHKEQIKLFCITLAVREPNSYNFYQQFGAFTLKSEDVNISQLVEHIRNSGALLEPITCGPNYSLNMQNNPNVSRKQLQPFIQTYLKSL